MVIVVALVVALGVAFLLWRAFGPQRPGPSARRGPVGPDDDTDFLLDLDRAHRRARPTSDGEADDPRP